MPLPPPQYEPSGKVAIILEGHPRAEACQHPVLAFYPATSHFRRQHRPLTSRKMVQGADSVPDRGAATSRQVRTRRRSDATPGHLPAASGHAGMARGGISAQFRMSRPANAQVSSITPSKVRDREPTRVRQRQPEQLMGRAHAGWRLGGALGARRGAAAGRRPAVRAVAAPLSTLTVQAGATGRLSAQLQRDQDCSSGAADPNRTTMRRLAADECRPGRTRPQHEEHPMPR